MPVLPAGDVAGGTGALPGGGASRSPKEGSTMSEAAHVLHEGDLVQHRESRQYGTVTAIRPHRRRWPVLVQHGDSPDGGRSYGPEELLFNGQPCRIGPSEPADLLRCEVCTSPRVSKYADGTRRCRKCGHEWRQV